MKIAAGMTAQVPTKIVLKSTTKMSLNDRFTSIQQQTRAQPTVPNIRANMAAQQQASAANRRLAQQLANRPGLGMGDFNQMQPMGMMNNNMGMMNNQMPPPQQRSLKQRLGRVNVKARLNLEAVGRGGMQNRGRGGFQRGGSRFPRGQGQGGSFQPRGRGGMRGGGGPRGGGISASPRGVRGRGRGTFRGGFNRYQDDEFQFSSWRGRGQGRRDQRRGGGNRGDRFGARGAGGGRGGSGGRGGMRGQGTRGRGGMRGRGRGRGRGAGGDSMSREQLDNQLDEYMSKTKSYLDSELDAYMAEANP